MSDSTCTVLASLWCLLTFWFVFLINSANTRNERVIERMLNIMIDKGMEKYDISFQPKLLESYLERYLSVAIAHRVIAGMLVINASAACLVLAFCSRCFAASRYDAITTNPTIIPYGDAKGVLSILNGTIAVIAIESICIALASLWCLFIVVLFYIFVSSYILP